MNTERVRHFASRVLARARALWYISRRAVRWLWFHCRRIWPNIAMQLGWGLLTWAAFGWNRRAWAASVGLFCFTWVGLKMYETYATAKANREQ